MKSYEDTVDDQRERERIENQKEKGRSPYGVGGSVPRQWSIRLARIFTLMKAGLKFREADDLAKKEGHEW